MNCRIPVSAARNRTALPSVALLNQPTSLMCGMTRRTASATTRSAS
jgi:hypothetical protein